MSYGFQVWDANGSPMVNMRMNTMRLVDRVSIGPMTTDTRRVNHPSCRAATTKAFVMPTVGGFGNGFGYSYNMRPRIRVFDGYFELYVKPGTINWLRTYTRLHQITGDMDVLLFTTE